MTGARLTLAVGIAITVGRAHGALPATAPSIASRQAVVDVPTPAGDGSGMYSLAVARDGTVYLGWIDPTVDGGHALAFATLDGNAWSPARPIAAGRDWFVNWADHPSVVPLSAGSLAAHWLVDNARRRGSYGYGLRVAHSADAGRSWSESLRAGVDNVEGYSGFVSLLSLDNGFMAAYLGPPPGWSTSPAPHQERMGLSVATFGSDGRLLRDEMVDDDTCTCCPTSLARTDRGPIAAYRDHVDGIRDIAVVRYRGGRWTRPEPLHRDGWTINACPTNGPSLAASGDRVAAVWFTAAQDDPRMLAAFSMNGGDRFGPVVRVDSGRPVGWPGVAMDDDGGAIVSWLQRVGDGNGEVRIRRVSADGRLGTPITVAATSPGRSTGVPQLVRSGERLVVAWRTDRVRTALVPVSALPALPTANGPRPMKEGNGS